MEDGRRHSVETGRWQRQPITPTGKEPIIALASDNVAVVRVGGQVFAFSGLAGHWDSAAVSDNRRDTQQ
jgi:hypothetical protein